MEERMRRLGTWVGYLFPRATREHVIGDLRERCTSPLSLLLAALSVFPYVLWGQIRRNVDPRLMLFQGAVLFMSFLLPVFPELRQNAAIFFNGQYGVARILFATLSAILALALGDAYVERGRRTLLHMLRQPALAYAAAILGNFLVPWLAMPGRIPAVAASLGFFFVFLARLIYISFFSQHRLPGAEAKPLESVLSEAHAFHQLVSRRNRREFIGVIILMAVCLALAVGGRSRDRLGFALGIPGGIFYAYQLRRRGTPEPMPSDLSTSGCLDFYRSELERQRGALLTVGWWGLCPLAPAVGALSIASVAAGHVEGAALLILLAVFLAPALIGLNRLAAAALMRKIVNVNELEMQA